MSDDRSDRRLLGVGAVACAACCAPLVPGLLAGLGLGGAAWATVGGGLALVVVAVTLAAAAVRRRRARHAACGPTDAMIPVAAPARRPTEAGR
jgi:hypothetical protein